MYSHTVWVVSQGLTGGYLPTSVTAFETEFQARSYIQDEIEFWNDSLWDNLEDAYEPYDASASEFPTNSGNEAIWLEPTVIQSDFADISMAVEEFNDW